MTITLNQIKELRQQTGIGIGDCKIALEKSSGDFEKAKLYLREKGKKLSSTNVQGSEGIIGTYVHHNKQIAVLVELNCQTDFAAKDNEGPFQSFARDLAMHIASANPTYVDRSEIPEEVLVKEKSFLMEQAKTSGKPEHIIETKIIPGQLERFYAQLCLLDQPFVKDETLKIKDLLADLTAKIGEVISVKRFIRYKVGA